MPELILGKAIIHRDGESKAWTPKEVRSCSFEGE